MFLGKDNGKVDKTIILVKQNTIAKTLWKLLNFLKRSIPG